MACLPVFLKLSAKRLVPEVEVFLRLHSINSPEEPMRLHDPAYCITIADAGIYNRLIFSTIRDP